MDYDDYDDRKNSIDCYAEDYTEDPVLIQWKKVKSI